MVKLVSFLIFALFSFNLCCQTDTKNDVIHPDNRLSKVFSQEYLFKLTVDRPQLIRKWNFYLDNSFFVSDFPKGKKEENALESIEVKDLKNINIKLLEKNLGIGPDYEVQRIYKIKNTNKILVYRSGKEFYKLYNEHTR